MDKQQARELIEQTFKQAFDYDRFHHFTAQLLNHLNDSPERQSVWSGSRIKKAYAEHVNHFERIGTYTDPEGRKLDVLVIHLKKETTLERGRTLLRNFAADYLSTGHGNDKDAVLAAYVSKEEMDWRFSYVKLEYALEQDETGKVKERKELTPARRYSFLVGENEKSHTAQKQFLSLLENDQSDPLLKEIEKAFDIEKVTKEFFEQYKLLFDKTKAALETRLKRDAQARAEFKEKAVETDDFAKKLLGQIVFLYFLQKKGWFGVKRDAAWGTGQKDYLRHLFNKKKPDENYFNDVLEPLFYNTLAVERSHDYSDRFRCKIPFLNGGLFEPLGDYNWVHADILLPDELFSNHERTKDGDDGTGILDVFDRYNFTVNEAEPLETEVAVDPEMLGKVFENLLPENLRHKGGTYYTPRVIVNYMCQQSLINYLASHLEGTVSREDIETFITRGEVLREFEANQRKDEKNILPDSIRKNAKQLDRLLAEITVCDPAIGSGAFPVGMMQEVVKARLTLASIEGMPERSAYDLKRHAIENSLYGVDVDSSAIEIARLRLWLSLVVDELEFKRIQPLPNLDYKIMQGNSLLEEFAGVKLFDDDLLVGSEQDAEAQKTAIREEIIYKQKQLIELAGKKIPSARELKAKFGKEIEQLTRQLNALSATPSAPQEDKLFRDLSIDVRDKLAELKRLHREFFEQSSPKKKKELRQKLEQLEWEFMELRLERSDPALLKELAKHRRDNRKNYFLWKLHFVEVFQAKGGFDVVIGNPPYIRIQEIQASAPAMATYFKQKYAAAGKGNYDIYVIFIERGLGLLNKTGFLSYIQPHKFFNAQYGAPLRKLIADGKHLLHVVHFGDQQIFAAVTTYTCLLFLSRRPVEQSRVVKVDDFEAWSNFRVGKEGAYPTTQLTANEWNFTIGKGATLFEMLAKAGPKLADVSSRIYQGVITSADGIFLFKEFKDSNKAVISVFSKELNEWIELERDVLKRVVRSGSIGKFWARTTAYVLFPYEVEGSIAKLISQGQMKKKYPLAWNYLLMNKQSLESREKSAFKDEQWYRFGRSQNLGMWEQPKLLAPYMITDLATYLDKSNAYYFVNVTTGGYGITCDEKFGSYEYICALLNSRVLDFYLKQVSTNFHGGYFAANKQYIEQLPIRTINFSDHSDQQRHREIVTLVGYILFLKDNADETESRDQLMVNYFEQIIDALVYELYLPEELHTAGREFFAPLAAERLPALADIRGDKLSDLRQIFERLFHKDHIIRQNIFFLDTIESVRIIEGKA